jgi:hypothetical protein
LYLPLKKTESLTLSTLLYLEIRTSLPPTLIKYINISTWLKKLRGSGTKKYLHYPCGPIFNRNYPQKTPLISEKVKPATKSIPRATKSLYITVVPPSKTVFAIRSVTGLKPYLLLPTMSCK